MAASRAKKDKGLFLTKDEMLRIVEQATIVLDEFYVHLPQKRAGRAFDPIQALRLLEARVESLRGNARRPSRRRGGPSRRQTPASARRSGAVRNADELREEASFVGEFHEEMSSIFNKLKDRHTYYELRDNKRIWNLPFIVRRSDDKGTRRYWVTHLVKSDVPLKYRRRGFRVGAEVTRWNGVPIEQAIEINAANFRGANRDAYLAQGLQYLCTRPAHRARPPAEAFVLVTYRPAPGGQRKQGRKPVEREARFEWGFYSNGLESVGESRHTSARARDRFRNRFLVPEVSVGDSVKGRPRKVANRRYQSARDVLDACGQFASDMAAVQRSRRSRKDAERQLLYEKDPSGARSTSPFPRLDRAVDETLMLAKLVERGIASAGGHRYSAGLRPLRDRRAPNFYAGRVSHRRVDYGYIRLHSFETDTPETLVRQFANTLKELDDTAGLILDIRDNPGGNVRACEGILQALAKKRLPPIPWEFINTKSTLKLVEESALKKYAPSMREAIATGAVYSQGFPEPQDPASEDLIGCYKRKNIVLVVNALCYSASDVFAAGFQDHKLGKVLGVDGRTGAGGAIVTRHSDLKDFFPDKKIKIDPVRDPDGWARLLKTGRSNIRGEEWAKGRYVSDPIDSSTQRTQSYGDHIDWFVKLRDGAPTDYKVSFLPWIANNALFAYAKTPDAIDSSRSRIKALPDGISISFSFRRTVRQGMKNLGRPLEDVGVQPDAIHHLTRDDVLLRGSPQLIAKAVSLLRGRRT